MRKPGAGERGQLGSGMSCLSTKGRQGLWWKELPFVASGAFNLRTLFKTISGKDIQQEVEGTVQWNI